MADVVMMPAARRDVDRLPQVIRARMLHILTRLGSWPNVSGIKPLRGPLTGHFRARPGDYRVQFHVKGDAVIVEKIGHPDRFYEE